MVHTRPEINVNIRCLNAGGNHKSWLIPSASKRSFAQPTQKTMKSLKRTVRIAAALSAVIAATQLAGAQSIWIGTNGISANTNWSAALNWSPNGVPGAATNVLFTNSATVGTVGTVNNFVDAAFAGTVGSIQYANTNANTFHTTQIASGQTLTIAGALTVGTTGPDLAAAGKDTVVSTRITGTGGKLAMTNTSANLVVNQASGTSGAHIATLDLSGLDTFNATIGRMLLGVAGAIAPAVNRDAGTLYLAKTNSITLSGTTPSLYLGFNNGNGGNPSILYLGQTNAIFGNSITVAADKQTGVQLTFNPTFTGANPVAYFRGASGGASRVSAWIMGDNSGQGTTGSTSAGTTDFTGGMVDALVDTMTLGKSEKSPATGGGGTGMFTFNAGTMDVNMLYVGFQTFAGGTSTGTGRVNVNDTASLVVNNAIALAVGTTGNGTLNITGGTVLANTITNGGGLSTINMTGGNLGITSLLGSVGTPGSPIGTLNIADSTLQLQVSGTITNIMATDLVPGGTTNIINITALPGIIPVYPVQDSLIGYVNLDAGANFGLGTLPAGSPSYQGYISNNTAHSTIDLVLTSGPTTGALLKWSGATSANWNTTSLNWLKAAVPALFQNGVLVQFDDTATGPTTVNLTATLLPASLLVSNNTLPYTFNGTGKLGGTMRLTKQGTGTLTVTNSGINDFIGGVTISAGAVQFGGGSTSGNLPAVGSVTNNGNLIFNRSDNFTVPNFISGAGTLTKNGNNVLTLTAANDFSGTTLVNAGSLMVDGVLSGGLTNAPGTAIGGTGTNLGPVNVGGAIQPGDVDGVGTFTSGALTLSSGAILKFDLNAADTTTGGGINDLVEVNGNLSLNNNSVSVNFLGVPQAGSTYRLIDYTGIQSGGFNPTVAGTHYAVALDASAANRVDLTVVGSSGANLKWNSTSSGAWDTGITTNWLNLGNSLPDLFYAGDTVLFDDTVAGVMTNVTIGAGVSAYPATVTINSSANNFSLAGAGQIGGAANIVKQGPSTFTLGTANSLTGTITVQAGTLKVGNNSALGNGTTFVTNGGTLDINGHGVANAPVTVSGAGVGGNGAIINTGADQQSAFLNLSLAGDTTFGALHRWDLRGTGSPASLNSADGNPYNLTIVGSNSVFLVSATIDSRLGNIDIQGGAGLALQVNTLSLSAAWAADATKSITVQSNASLEFFGLNALTPLGRTVVLKGGSALLCNNGSATVSGPMAVQGSAVVRNDATLITLSSGITGSGGLFIIGSGPTKLTGSNAYTGATIISNSTTTVDGSIGGSGVTVKAGTLAGIGAISAPVTITPNGTLSPAGNGAGTLTISGALSLSGTNSMDVNKVGNVLTGDLITGVTTLSLGGTLQLNITGDPLTAGDTIALYNFTSAGGAFTAIDPATPGTGLVWDTASLTVNGTLKVATPRPHVGALSISGTSLNITGTGGLPNTTYSVLTSTNVSLPLTNWTQFGTGSFDGTGAFNFTGTINPANPQRFYLLQTP
jgi:fibronectin-binding autotransporter adhesin